MASDYTEPISYNNYNENCTETLKMWNKQDKIFRRRIMQCAAFQ